MHLYAFCNGVESSRVEKAFAGHVARHSQGESVQFIETGFELFDLGTSCREVVVL